MRLKIGLAALSMVGVLTALIGAQEPKTSVRTVAALSGRIDRIDNATRSLILRIGDNQYQSVFVGPEVKIFNELKAGDDVTIRVQESVVVAMRPNTRPSVITDTTAAAKKASPSSDVMQQLKAVVTVESVDTTTQIIIYKTGDNRRVMRAVADPKLLEGLKANDVIEITYTRERAVEIERR
jgi:hypothetical protein